jgi:hypothetical protein
MEKLEKGFDFNKRLIKIGIVTLCCASVANFIPVIYLWIAHGIVPSGKDIMTIWGLAFATYGVSWIVQPVAYFSMLGASGSYIAWLSGSVADIRLPAVAMAQKVAGVESGTHEGDVISTIGITSSVFISVTMITIFTFVGAQIIDILPKFFTDSFKYILPSLFGAVYLQLSSKHLRSGAVTFIIGILVMYFGPVLGIGSAYLTLIVVISGMIVCRAFFIFEKNKNSAN